MDILSMFNSAWFFAPENENLKIVSYRTSKFNHAHLTRSLPRCPFHSRAQLNSVAHGRQNRTSSTSSLWLIRT